MKMTAKEILSTIGTMILMLIMAAIMFAEWLAVGLFVYCLFN